MLICSDLFIFVVRVLFGLFYDLVDCVWWFLVGYGYLLSVLSVLL